MNVSQILRAILLLQKVLAVCLWIIMELARVRLPM